VNLYTRSYQGLIHGMNIKIKNTLQGMAICCWVSFSFVNVMWLPHVISSLVSLTL